MFYGDKRFTKCRQRISNEAKSIDLYDKIIIETEDILNDEEFKDTYNKNPEFKEVFDRGYFDGTTRQTSRGLQVEAEDTGYGNPMLFIKIYKN